MAEMRRRRKSALVQVTEPGWAAQLGVKVGAWVRLDPHPPSDTSYTTTGCAHCRPVHTAAAQNRVVGRRLGERGDAETDVMSLGAIHALTRAEIDEAIPPLAALARHKLDALVREATIPPPPPPNARTRPRRT